MNRQRIQVSTIVMILAVLALASLPAAGAPPAPDSLQQDVQGSLTITRDPATGAVTFARGMPGVASGTTPAELAQDAYGTALSFLTRHELALGMPGVANNLVGQRVVVDELGMTHVRFGQAHQGVPVFGAEVIVHYAPDTSTVRAVNGHYVPSIVLDSAPRVTAGDAVRRAQSIEPDARVWSKPELVVYSQVIDPAVSGNHLAWLVRLADDTRPARTLYVIDAHSGAVLTSYNELDTARVRQVYTANHSQTLPGTLVRGEGAPPTGDADADHAYDYLGDTYNYYFNGFGRDSYDNGGAAMRATVHYGTNYQNAFWNGTQMVFGDGFPIDDVTAHEMTHAVTEHEANLVYQNQSGALNESFSDIFGEIIDMTNGAGNDTQPVAWLMGEDLPGIGAIRSMADPPQFGDPDRVSAYVCTTSDNGGVHTNSGIPNKAAYLMAAGGTFNGRTVSGIGLDKMGRVQYRSLAQYLTASATLVDDYNALNQSCLDLVGTAGITAADCTQVDTALLAVEMNTAPSCTGGGCVIQETAGDRSLFTSPAEAIQLTLLMYQAREQVLRGTPAGDHLIDLYYRHSAAVAAALARDPVLRQDMAAFLREVAPGLDALRRGDHVRADRVLVSPAAISRLRAVLHGLVAADPHGALAQAIRAEQDRFDLDALVGQSYAAAWQRMNVRMVARD